ncbi:antitoxin VapB family protein [Candidatus Woesearchaeota archaeon]|nr:antitoxin VapB family protein [Candidatus Woesearchaeota archaeon]
MGNINISIKEEAYNFLNSLKAKNKSFSDVILEFKEAKGNKEHLMSFFGVLNKADIDWVAKEKAMKEFRDSFNRRMEKTTKEMETSRK